MNNTNGDLLDRPAKDAFTTFLKEECVSDYYACGFTQKSSDPIVLQKNTADSRIIITIYNSSVSESMELSTSNLQLEQEERSKRVTNHFLNSIESDAVLFYLGHSRFGTGPGFYCLPPLSTQWLSTYINSPLLSDTLRKLEQTPTPPNILGLYSCSSKRHYAKKIHTAAPEMALIVSDGTTDYGSILAEAANALNSILGNICYAKPSGTAIGSAPKPDFKLYGLFLNNGFPNFRSNASLLSVSVYIFILPILIIILSKLYSLHVAIRVHIQTYFKDIIFIIILPTVSFYVSYSILKLNHGFREYSIPFFIILSGLLLLGKFYFQQKNIFLVVIKTVQASVAPLVFSIFILFVPSIVAEPSMNQLTISIVDAARFVVFFIGVLPFVVFSTEILKYPLWNDTEVNVAIRTFVFLITSMLLYVVITYSSVYLSAYIFPYKGTILLFFLYIQGISLMLYHYKKTTSLPIIFQALVLTLIFSENIHGLFF